MSAGGLEQAPIEQWPIFAPDLDYTSSQPKHEEPRRALFLVGNSALGSEIAQEKNWPIPTSRFDRRLCTLSLDFEEEGLIERLIDEPELSKLLHYGFQPKNDLHITILSYGNGGRIQNALNSLTQERQNSTRNELEKIASELDWSWRPTGQLYPFKGRLGGNLKLVTMVDCPGVDTFYESAEDLMPELLLERHPMHITLMKKPGEINGYGNSLIGGIALGNPLRTLDHLKDK